MPSGEKRKRERKGKGQCLSRKWESGKWRQEWGKWKEAERGGSFIYLGKNDPVQF